MVTLHTQEDMEYLGLLHSHTGQTIGDISRKYSVTFSAFMPEREFLSTSTSLDSSKLCILIYGFQTDSESIGQALSENNLFLQHPHSYDTDVTYSNPHYLGRPGRSLDIPKTHSELPGKSPPSSKMQNESVKNEILQALDQAHGPQDFSVIAPSDRLCTTLKA